MTGARGTTAGAGLAGLTLLALLPLSHSLSTTCAAVLLAVVAGIYVGFAIVDGRPTAILGEAAAVAVAGALVALALYRGSLALVGWGSRCTPGGTSRTTARGAAGSSRTSWPGTRRSA